MRCYSTQLCFNGVAHIQSLYKIMYTFFSYCLVSTSQSFQSLVWVWISLAAQNCLNGFCHHSPAIIKVTFDAFLMQQQFA